MISDESITDEDLVIQALKHPYDFAQLVKRYEAKLLRYIRRLGVNSVEDAEEVLQNAFINAYRKLNSFDTSLSFSSWIYRIAHNEVINHYRKSKARPQGHYANGAEDILAKMQDDTDIIKDAELALGAKDLENAINALKQKYKDIIVLRYFEEREYKEISDILQIPMGSVATLLYRAKRALRKNLEQSN